MPRQRGEYGSNMVKVTVRFWTNNVGTNDPKVAWEGGTVSLNANRSRGIPAQPIVRFNTLDEMPTAIREALKNGEIKLKPNSKNYVKL